MQDPLDKTYKSGELIANLFSATLVVAKACLELSRHRRFMDCKADVFVLQQAERRLVGTYETHVIYEKLSISGTEEVIDPYKIEDRALDMLQPRKRMIL